MMACFKKYTSRISRAMRRCRPYTKATGQKPARALEISAPFGFKRETTALPGLNDDELNVLREKALASRVGVRDGHCVRPSPSSPVRQAGGPISSNPAPGLREDAAENDLDEKHRGVPVTATASFF